MQAVNIKRENIITGTKQGILEFFLSTLNICCVEIGCDCTGLRGGQGIL